VTPSRGRERRRLAAVAVALASLATLPIACAPHAVSPPAIDTATIQSRCLSAMTQRERRARAANLLAGLWLRTQDDQALPAVSARVVLQGPDAFRLRIESVIGTALDLSARGDTLAAFVPSGRVGIETPTAGDSLGVRDPGSLGARLWSATWRPPAEAWGAMRMEGENPVVRWREADDSLSMALDAQGRPTRVTLARGRRAPVRVEYVRWQSWEGTGWPAHFECRDDRGKFRLTCRVENAHFPPESAPSRVTLRLPDDVERISREELMSMLERLTSVR
jgi:hypothetical protein